ncbi:MAG TPA: capsular biosynthesis protein, partial [Ruminococcus sp.]|nr:capsular biosynthesis protein [Ruminococcus sp.]
TEKEIWLTGMPRYDLLHHNEKRYITIMPTWRKTLMSRVMDEELHTPMWVINDDFEQSSYFRFYNELVNNEKLLENARRYGYTICFMPHTMVLPKIDLFTKNPDVIFFDLNKSCREVFAESDLMVTDYSSVAFDFAYLEKPVVYSQFDREEFFAGHSYSEGYFDYERDGFGEVAYNAEDTVELIIEYMKNGCKLKPEYKKRSNEFFAFQDKNCCRRICDKIIENDEFFGK